MSDNTIQFNKIDPSSTEVLDQLVVEPVIADIHIRLCKAHNEPDTELGAFNKLYGINFNTATEEELTTKLDLLPANLRDTLSVVLGQSTNDQEEYTLESTKFYKTYDNLLLEYLGSVSADEIIDKLCSAPKWNGYTDINNEHSHTKFLSDHGVVYGSHESEDTYLNAIKDLVLSLLDKHEPVELLTTINKVA